MNQFHLPYPDFGDFDLKIYDNPDFKQMNQFHDERRVINKCPKCGGTLLYRKDNILCCLNKECYYEWKAKREGDNKIKTMAEIEHDWGLV
mgnify:CR=1 FL=1